MSEEITTAEELDALPVGSVIFNRHGVAWQHIETRGGHSWWFAPGERFGFESTEMPEGYDLPFTVVYRAPEPGDAA